MGQEVESRLHMMAAMGGQGGEFTPPGDSSRAAALLKDNFDPEHGGLGGAPKFPRSLELAFLLAQDHLSGDREGLARWGFTLEKMARGGIYDQLGGGFHRYTVDGEWVVPHFEKMLYDNALLVPFYLAHYQLTGDPLSRRIAAGDPGLCPAGAQGPPGGLLCRLGCGQRRGGRQVLRLERPGSGRQF